MKDKLERMRTALNELSDEDLTLIQESNVFYDSAIEQIVKHLEWMVLRKQPEKPQMERVTRKCPRCGYNQQFFTEEGMNSYSRLNNGVEICQSCALDESLNDHVFDHKWAVPQTPKGNVNEKAN